MYLDLGGRQQRLSINTKDVRKWKRVHQCGKSLEIFLIRLSFLVVDMSKEAAAHRHLLRICRSLDKRIITLNLTQEAFSIRNISRHYDNARDSNKRDSLI
jgi:hypothetical protein